MALNTQTARLKLPQIVGYGLGDFGSNLFFTGLNLYLLFYYTDVLGLPAGVAGLIFMLPLFWDGLFDPVMGWIASRTRSRFGRYRPYLLFATPLMCLSFVAMFAAPLSVSRRRGVGERAQPCAVSHLLCDRQRAVFFNDGGHDAGQPGTQQARRCAHARRDFRRTSGGGDDARARRNLSAAAI